jgi:hypothetical protein
MDCPSNRTTETRRRVSSPLACALVLACALLLAACSGGSGSSGFDAAAENAAIARALQSQGCQTIEGLTICASGSATPTPLSTPTGTPAAHFTLTPSPSATPGGVLTPTTTPHFASPSPTTTLVLPNPTTTPTATPVPSQPSVVIDVGPNNTLPCRRTLPGAPCVAVVTFHPIGAPADAAYRVAVRTVSQPNTWTVVPVTDNSAAVEVNPSSPAYQLAVLLFLSEPGPIPVHITLLSQSGADFAFVTPALTPVETAAASSSRAPRAGSFAGLRRAP